MSLLSLNKRMWGGRVSDPPIKAGAERKKKTVVQGFSGEKAPGMGAEPAGREPCLPAAVLEGTELT